MFRRKEKTLKDRKKRKERETPSFRKVVFAFIINSFMIVLACLALYIMFIFIQMPSLDAILYETRSPAIVFLDDQGDEIRSSNRIMGTPVSVDTLPPHVWQSIVAIEDKRFFDHGAIDIRGLSRAMMSNLIRGRIAAGGSSITQQTAKNIFLSREKKLSRKIQELILSYWLENRFDKNQILDLYMNRVSLVGGLRGIDAASRILFQKTATEMSIAESAQIAAMLKAPTSYSPLRYPERNIARARVILKEMVRQEYITLSQAQVAAKELSVAKQISDTNLYRYWTDFVMDEAMARIGVLNSDLRIYTTLDAPLQERVAAKITKNTDKYQGAALAMSHDGAIKSMVGGSNYQSSQFNRATAMRQPGSVFKPIVYLVALENGMTPDTIVNDSVFSVGDYNPKNYNDKYYGNIKLSVAFARSLNSIPVKLTHQFGIDEILGMAGRLGVGAKLRREYSTVLGSSEMTLLDLTTMYSVVWNNGYSVRPYSITKMTDFKGNILYEHNPSEPLQLLSSQTVQHMTTLMSDVVNSWVGTGRRASVKGVLGGKTGTSNDNRDAWFIGATDSLTMGIWVGNDDFSPMDNKITGGTIPAQIFKEIIHED